MKLFLRFKDTDSKTVEEFDEVSSDVKYLEEKASAFHTEIREVNQYLTKSLFVIETSIAGSYKENNYKLAVKIEHYDNRSGHEHKENTHRQKIDI